MNSDIDTLSGVAGGGYLGANMAGVKWRAAARPIQSIVPSATHL